MLFYLAERYGPEIVTVMMDNLSGSAGVDDWLARSAGIRFEDIREAWQAAYTEAISR